jgi:hypothetical protein
MTARMRIALVFLLLLTGTALAAGPERASVAATNGNVFLTASGKQVQLTTSGNDLDPVLSPNGSLVVFTRKVPGVAAKGSCDMAVAEQRELWVIGADKAGERKLLTSQDALDPKQTLCDYMKKQFSADGRKVLFETPAWATSGALHEYDLTTNRERYIIPSNGFRILSNCAMREYRDHLVVSQHRYFVFGGSYDWYYLFSPDGKRELGAIGEDLGPLEEACEVDLNLGATPSTPAQPSTSP